MKSRLIRLTSFLFVFAILLMPFSVSAESKPITKENTFTTDDENFNYDFDKNIKIKDKEYKLSDVQYTILDKTPKETEKTVKKTKKYLDLYTKSCSADKQLQIERYGQSVTVNLDKITYEDTTITGRYTTAKAYQSFGYTTSKPKNIPDEKEISYKDKYSGETVTTTLPLKRVEVGKKVWKDDVEIPITFKVYGADYYELGNKKIAHNDEKPLIDEKTILNELNLSTKTYRINSIKWNGKSYTKNGKKYRKAVAYGERYVAQYKAVYQDTIDLPDCDGYIATAHYVGTVKVNAENDFTYKVKATATYEPIQQPVKNNNNVVKYIAIGVGVLLLVTAIVLILFFIAKKRKKNNE